MQDRLDELVTDYANGYFTRRGFLAKVGALGLSATAAVNLADQAEAGSEAAREPGQIIGDAVAGGAWEVVDLSLTTAENHPTNWPTDPQFHVIPMTWFKRIPGPNGTNGAVEPSDAAVQRYEINEHTATQIDFPPHFIPPPGLDIPGAPGSRWGLVTGDKIELAAFMGPAVVVDVRDLLNSNHTAGVSAHITRDWLLQWEQRYGRFRANEVPMWFSGYTDRYYRPFPDNDRFQDRMLWKPIVEKSEPGWVAAGPGAVELLHERGVRHAVTDAPSWGAVEDGQPGHVAGLRHGMTWTEGATNLGSLPVRGAFYIGSPYKVKDQQAAIARAFAIKAAGASPARASAPLRL